MSKSKRAKEARQRAMQREKYLAEKKASIANMTLFGTGAKKGGGTYTPPDTFRRDDGNAEIPSLNSGMCNTSKKESQQYTGTFVKGIGTMHKSNAIPVVDEEFMVALSQMRRN